MTQRLHQNYGGLYRKSDTFTGKKVINFACPTRMNISNQNGEITYNFNWEIWQDRADFENNQQSEPFQRKEFNSQQFTQEEIQTNFGDIIKAVKSGTLSFLDLNSDDFEFISINVDVLNFNISAQAKHQTRERYQVSDFVSGVEEFEKIKLQYLQTITMPLIGMARVLAKTNRDLADFLESI